MATELQGICAELHSDRDNLSAIAEWCAAAYREPGRPRAETVEQTQAYLVDALSTVGQHVGAAGASLLASLDAQRLELESTDATMRLVESRLAYHRAKLGHDAASLALAVRPLTARAGPALSPLPEPPSRHSCGAARSPDGRIDLAALRGVGAHPLRHPPSLSNHPPSLYTFPCPLPPPQESSGRQLECSCPWRTALSLPRARVLPRRGWVGRDQPRSREREHRCSLLPFSPLPPLRTSPRPASLSRTLPAGGGRRTACASPTAAHPARAHATSRDSSQHLLRPLRSCFRRTERRRRRRRSGRRRRPRPGSPRPRPAPRQAPRLVRRRPGRVPRRCRSACPPESHHRRRCPPADPSRFISATHRSMYTAAKIWAGGGYAVSRRSSATHYESLFFLLPRCSARTLPVWEFLANQTIGLH